jgi:hypothetical protein
MKFCNNAGGALAAGAPRSGNCVGQEKNVSGATSKLGYKSARMGT